MPGYPDDYKGGYRRTTLHMKCYNDDCGHEWDAPGSTENGMTDFDDESDKMCPQCGMEGFIQ